MFLSLRTAQGIWGARQRVLGVVLPGNPQRSDWLLAVNPLILTDQVKGNFDQAPEPPRDPVSRPGDLWRLGRHRLLCGDSTDASTVARVMEGERTALVFTSTPYGNQRDYGIEANIKWKETLGGEWRQYEDIFPAINRSKIE